MKLSGSMVAFVKSLVVLVVLLIFADLYLKTIPFYLQSQALYAIHWLSL